MKGQIQFGESIMVVIVLVFILIIGMVFYFNATRAGISNELRERDDIDAIILAQNALNLPELRCGRLVAKGDCIDWLKVDALSKMLNSSSGSFDSDAWEYYSLLFGYATIKLHMVTTGGEMASGEYITLYDDTPSFNRTLQNTQYLFTTAYNPQSGSVDLVYLNVTRYMQGGTS